MILNVKEKSLDDVKLSKKECRFLMALLNNRLVLTENVFEFVYGFKAMYKAKMTNNLSRIKNRLIKKTQLEIKARRDLGYILQDIVEVE